MTPASPTHSVSNEKASTDHRDADRTSNDEPITTYDRDAEFGGTEARKALEKKLLRKVDLHMSILIFIYILNYVSQNLKLPRSLLITVVGALVRIGRLFSSETSLDRPKQRRVKFPPKSTTKTLTNLVPTIQSSASEGIRIRSASQTQQLVYHSATSKKTDLVPQVPNLPPSSPSFMWAILLCKFLRKLSLLA